MNQAQPPELHDNTLTNEHSASPQKPRNRRSILLLIAVFASLLVTAAGIFTYLLLSNKHTASNGSSKHSVTLYYRDGKTVLWQQTESSDDLWTGAPAVVYEELRQKFGDQALSKGEWNITTTLDESLQKKAQELVLAQKDAYAKQKVDDTALIAQDFTTGQIIAWVGSLDQALPVAGEDNGLRLAEVGTLALPFNYAALIESTTNNGAGTVTTDIAEPLPGYPCTDNISCLTNFDKKYVGQLTLRQALGKVRLVPAVKAMTSVIPGDESPMRADSINKTVSTIKSMIGDEAQYACYLEARIVDLDPTQSEETQCYAAAALGDGVFASPQHMVQAYATLANNGKRQSQTSLLKVKINEKETQLSQESKQVIKDETAYIVSDILADQTVSYLNRKDAFWTGDTGPSNNRVSVMQGTETSGNFASSVQFGPQYVVGFWIMNRQDKISGFTETITLPVGRALIRAAHQGQKYPERTKPSGIRLLSSSAITLNTLTGGNSTSPAEDFYPSWYK